MSIEILPLVAYKCTVCNWATPFHSPPLTLICREPRGKKPYESLAYEHVRTSRGHTVRKVEEGGTAILNIDFVKASPTAAEPSINVTGVGS